MRNMQTMKGSIGVLVLLFAASLLLLLLGCQAPAGPQADRTGTVSLTIGQFDMGRAIQPGTVLGNFTSFTAVFAHATYADVPVNFAAGETEAQVELYQGNWELTVRAYINAVFAATYSSTVNVGAEFTSLTATLAPIPTGGSGTFSWALTVPTGTIGTLELRTVDANGSIVMAPILPEGADFDGSTNPTLWGDYLELAAGTYFVRFILEHDDHGVAFLNSDLHVYQGMTSHVVRSFAAAQFGPVPEDIDIENAAVSVTAPATGAVPVTTATVGAGANFTGAVTWYPAHSTFQGETVYTATVTLTANPGHVFADGLTATINGQAATVTDNTSETVRLAYTFAATGPETEPVVLAAWEFTGTTSFDAAIVGPANIAIRPSAGQQQSDTLLQFLTLPGGDLTPRVLSWTAGGVNVVNPDGGNGGLDGLANSAWWQTAITTTSRTDIAVEWRMRSTNTGPRDWRLQYRVGSTSEWNNVGDTIALPSGNPALAANPLNRRFLPPSAEGHERLYLRWLMTSDVATNGSTVVAGGTHQINNLVIRSGVEPPPDNGYDCEHCNDEGCDICDPPPSDIMSIYAVNLMTPGATVATAEVVTVEGFVTNRTMNAGGTALDNFNIFLQDGTGSRDGILVWGGGTGNRNISAYAGQWVRVTGYVTRAGGAASPRNQIQVGGGGGTAGAITVITPAATPTFEAQAVQLADIVAPNNDYWFMPISLGPVRFGHNENRATFLTTAGDNAPARSHFVIVDGGQRLELRPPVGDAGYLPLNEFTHGEYIIITRAYVTWQNGRQAIQLLHAQVEALPLDDSLINAAKE